MSEKSRELSNDMEETGNGGMQLLLLWDSLELLPFHDLSAAHELTLERKGLKFTLENRCGKINVLARAGL